MNDDTQIGGALHQFPSTTWTDILALADATTVEYAGRMDRLLHIYWKPVYVYIRVAWNKTNEDAKDLTQAFFAYLLEKRYLSHLQPGGSFRGYLKRALQHFLISVSRSERVRRPEKPMISLDVLPEVGTPAAGAAPESEFDREWFHCLIEDSIRALGERLGGQGKGIYFEVFQSYCLNSGGKPTIEGPADSPTYREIAERMKLNVSDVRNYLVYARAQLLQILQERVRDYVATTDDIQEELREVLGG